MHKLVRDYLAQKDQEAQAKAEEYKRKVLTEEGIYEKEYPTTETFDNNEYCHWDVKQQKYYKVVPIEVSDEEFTEIEKRHNASNKTGDGFYDNIGKKIMGYAVAWFWIGFISSIIKGFVMIASEDVLEGLLVAVGGSLVSWGISWFVYAYGQLVDDMRALRRKIDKE